MKNLKNMITSLIVFRSINSLTNKNIDFKSSIFIRQRLFISIIITRYSFFNIIKKNMRIFQEIRVGYLQKYGSYSFFKEKDMIKNNNDSDIIIIIFRKVETENQVVFQNQNGFMKTLSIFDWLKNILPLLLSG